MKITSGNAFYGSGNTLVVFTGSGSTDGSNTFVIRELPLANMSIGYNLHGDLYHITLVSTEIFDFMLKDVENQPTWTDDAAGYDAMQKDIQAWMQAYAAGSGTGGSTQTVVKVGVELTRPTGTDQYTAKDVISNSTSSPTYLTFTGMCDAGGSGTITKVRIQTDNKAFVNAQLRLHLFDSSTDLTAINDNSPYLLLYANASKRIGMVDVVTSTEDPTNSTSALGANHNVYLDFTSATGNLFGILEVLTTITPASAQKFYVELTGIKF